MTNPVRAPRLAGGVAATTQARFFRFALLALLALGSAVALLGNQAFAESRYGKQKVVYHINEDDPKAQKGALINIQNHIDAVGKENLELKVVLHGNGVSLLLEPDSLPQLPKFKHANADLDMTAKVDTLKGQGVKFEVCNNTLVGRGATKADLYGVDDADIVPSGVAELSRLQAMGYSYIKP